MDSNKKLDQNTTASNQHDSEHDNVKELPIFIDENNVQDGARQILSLIRSNWKHEYITFKWFTDGITNKLVGCFYNPPDVTQSLGNPAKCKPKSSEANGSNAVLIRVYGNKTDMLIDRDAEKENIRMLNKFGLAPCLFATFRNGIAYEYVPGETLRPETIVQAPIFTLVAQKIAEMHRMDFSKFKRKENPPMIEVKINKFLNLIPSNFSDLDVVKRVSESGLPSVSELKVEFEFLYGHLAKLGSPIVFCHNDLLLGNVIYSRDSKRVTFIDFEYADYNYQAFDIGNHFTEFPGIDEVDFSLYPSREFQLQWLDIYLRAYHNVPEVSKMDLERLYVQVNQFALASHFLWMVWGLIQAEYSKIDFDFVLFAANRHKEYMKRRDEFLALKWDSL